jgi:mannose-1-phosphate guanylyltransferase
MAGWDSGAPLSIEREIYPALIARGAPVYSMRSDAYWIDLGTPEKYLQAHVDVLRGSVAGISAAAPFVAPTASVDPGAVVAEDVVVGERSVVGGSVHLVRTVLLDGVVVEAGATIRDSIVGPGARIGAGASLEHSVLAAEVTVEPGAALHGARISAGRSAGAAAS